MSETNEIQSENKRNKFLPILFVGGLVALSYIFYILQKNEQIFSRIAGLRNIALTQPLVEQNQEADESEINQDSAQHQQNLFVFKATQDGQTPFYLLDQEKDVEFDQYDFGVFVSSINGQKSNNEYYWAVYVNGEYSQEASDKLVLETGDTVEWRWEEVKAFE